MESEWKKPVGAKGVAAFPPHVRREIARRGGLATSQNRALMAENGRKGAAALVAKYGKDYFRELSKKSVSARKIKQYMP